MSKRGLDLRGSTVEGSNFLLTVLVLIFALLFVIFRLERELEIILAQQKELEELLTPLEKEVLTNHARATQGADRERRRM